MLSSSSSSLPIVRLVAAGVVKSVLGGGGSVGGGVPVVEFSGIEEAKRAMGAVIPPTAEPGVFDLLDTSVDSVSATAGVDASPIKSANSLIVEVDDSILEAVIIDAESICDAEGASCDGSTGGILAPSSPLRPANDAGRFGALARGGGASGAGNFPLNIGSELIIASSPAI